jgi:hypothetical protein
MERDTKLQARRDPRTSVTSAGSFEWPPPELLQLLELLNSFVSSRNPRARAGWGVGPR